MNKYEESKHKRNDKGRYANVFNPTVKSLKSAGLMHPNGVILFSLMGQDYTCNFSQFINFIRDNEYENYFEYCILVDGKARYRYDIKENKAFVTENSKEGRKKEVGVSAIPITAKLVDVQATYPNVFKKILDDEIKDSTEMKKSATALKQTKFGIDKNGHKYTRRVNILQYEHTNPTGGTIHPITDKNIKKPVESTKGGHWYDKYKHLNLNKYPAGIPESEVTLNLEGDLDSHAIMTWKDSKNRTIYAYTGEFCKRNAEQKWARISKVDSKIINSILKSTTKMIADDPELHTMEAQAAAIIKIIANTGLRPGSIRHFGVTGNRGVSTLAPESIQVTGDTILFDFTGKSHKKNLSKIEDKDLAKALFSLQKRQKEQKETMLFDIDRAYTDNIFKNKLGYRDVLLKDMRTYIATALAKDILYSDTEFASKLSTNKTTNKKLIIAKLNEVDNIVSKKLNNTPAMAKKSYIHPAIKTDWLLFIGQRVEDFIKSFNYDTLVGIDLESENIPTLDTVIKRSYFIGSYPNLNPEDEEYCDLYNTLPFEDEGEDLYKSVKIGDLKKEYREWFEGDENNEHYGIEGSVKEFLENNHEDNMDLLEKLCNSLKKGLDSEMAANSEMKPDVQKNKGCAMLYFDFPELNLIQEMIDPEDLMTVDPEDGRYLGFENEAHVTLLFGFTDMDYDKANLIVNTALQYHYEDVRLEGVGLFENKNYDVLKFNAVNKTLNEVNERLRSFPHDSKFPDYKPHLTIAYLKSGTGKKYAEKLKTATYMLKPTMVVLSKKDCFRICRDVNESLTPPLTSLFL